MLSLSHPLVLRILVGHIHAIRHACGREKGSRASHRKMHRRCYRSIANVASTVRPGSK
jgi:hypothetical protein